MIEIHIQSLIRVWGHFQSTLQSIFSYSDQKFYIQSIFILSIFLYLEHDFYLSIALIIYYSDDCSEYR